MNNKERNFAVYKMRLAGSTYREIADQYDISIERARQICINLQNKNIDEMESDLYQLIVDDSSHNYTLTLYNTLRRIGITDVEDLQLRIDDINEHPENYVYIGQKSRSYLNERLELLKKNAWASAHALFLYNILKEPSKNAIVR